MKLPDVDSWLWLELERAADARSTGEDYVVGQELEETVDIPELAEIDSMLGELRNAIDLVRRHVKLAMTDSMAENGVSAYRHGEYIYRLGAAKDWHAADDDALDTLIGWAGEDWRELFSVTTSTRIKKGGLRALAEKRGTELQALLDTFVREEEGDVEMQATRIDYAPKFLQSMREGETR